MDDNNKIESAWKKIAAYLKEGISLIPVRDKADSKHAAKTPFFGWKQYQEVAITEAELFAQMSKWNTTATAFICGPVSGNLEICDIDVKNWTGIDIMLFTQIQQLMPELWKVLRIHKTPSGGYHIIYKIADHEPEGNLKLAWKEGAKEAAIETRGNGGYALTDSSLNYTVHKDEPIPTITWLDRCSLKAICESFNQKIKVEAIKPRKEQSDFYENNENPFEDFNGKDGGAILAEHGWKPIGENAKFIWFTRPGKTEGISASFNREKNIYFVFTSSTEFEPSVGYFPSMVLSKLQFNNDNKEVYRYLVEKGFGRVNKAKEFKYAERLAKDRQPIPNNFSPEAHEKYKEVVAKLEEAYPFGTFIKINPEDDKGKLEVSRDDLYYISSKLGFRLHDGYIVRIEDEYIVRKCTVREYYDEMKEYIKADEPEELTLLQNIYEKFIEKHGKFTISRLEIFDTELLIKDDKQNAFQFFRNGWLHITSSVIEFKDYSLLTQLVFKEKIRNRDYVETDESGLYGEYLENAVGFK